MKEKIIRTATVAMSLNYLLKGQLSFLNEHYEVIAVSGEDDHLQEVRERENVRTENVKIQRTISLLKDLKSLWVLYFLFRKEKPQIVHSITPKAGLLSMLAAKMTGVPIRIHTFTGLIFPEKRGFLQQILILMDCLICFCATDIFPEGEGVKRDLIKYKITSKPLKIIANGNVNGIDTAYFSEDQVLLSEREVLKKELGIDSNDFVFIFVGRLVGDKGINELVSVFKEVTSQNKNVKLVLVGPLESDLDRLNSQTLKEIENNDAILSVGFKKDVRTYFAISDVLVFPSYREGFPNVVLQAGAMGLPAIVTNINGSNEIIKAGINGLIIEAKDKVALQQAMQELMKDKRLYETLKFNARELITSRYEQKMVWEHLLLEYKRKENGENTKINPCNYGPFIA
jgi:glycosyltransferase involved in cell wall biosynthesis